MPATPFTPTNDATLVWRLYNTDGVEASGKYSPQKLVIQGWGTEVEEAINGIIDGGELSDLTVIENLTVEDSRLTVSWSNPVLGGVKYQYNGHDVNQLFDNPIGTDDFVLSYFGGPSLVLSDTDSAICVYDASLYVSSGDPVTTGGFLLTSGASGSQFYRKGSSANGQMFSMYSDVFSTNGLVLNIQNDGDIFNYNNTFGALSDAALKDEVVQANTQLDDIMQLNVVNFKYRDDKTKLKQIGLIAQEVQQVKPGLVKLDEKTGMLGIKYSVLTPILLKALQEEVRKREALEQRMEQLETVVQQLQQRTNGRE